MPAQPISMALNDAITGTTDATTDLLYEQGDGVGVVGMASAFNSSGNSQTVSIYVLNSGEDADDFDPTWSQTIAAGKSAILPGLLGQVIPNGGALRAFASTTDVVRVTISGSVSV